MNQRQKETVVQGMRKCGAGNFRKTETRNMFCQKNVMKQISNSLKMEGENVILKRK